MKIEYIFQKIKKTNNLTKNLRKIKKLLTLESQRFIKKYIYAFILSNNMQ